MYKRGGDEPEDIVPATVFVFVAFPATAISTTQNWFAVATHETKINKNLTLNCTRRSIAPQNSDGLAKLSTRLLKLLPSEDRGGLRIARRTATLTTIATELIELLLV